MRLFRVTIFLGVIFNLTQSIASTEILQRNSTNIKATLPRPEGDFFALCEDQSWEIATKDQIHEGNLCRAETGPVGQWELGFDRGCFGSYKNYQKLIIKPNGEWQSDSLSGKWQQTENLLRLWFYSNCMFWGGFNKEGSRNVMFGRKSCKPEPPIPTCWIAIRTGK